MKKYVLFSCVGDTDPYRDGYDGSMIHIVRYYRPKKVYLYYSKEKRKEEDINNRCKRAIHYLDNNIEIQEYPKEEKNLLKDVHKYDDFYAPFIKIINTIKMENPESIILLNMSSGTPAMKTTMALINILFNGTDTKLIQVATPKKSTNANVRHDNVSKDENVEYIMENLIDNLVYEGENLNRCTEENLEQTRKIITYENIIKMLSKYDFCGIYNILEERKKLFNSQVVEYAQHLYYRYIGETEKAIEIARSLNKENEYYPIKDEKTKWIIEKYNILDIKLKRKEYQDYLIGLGTLIEEIEKKMLEIKGIEISKFTYIAKDNSSKELKKDNDVDAELLNKYYPNIYEKLRNEKIGKLNWTILGIMLKCCWNENDKLNKIPEKIENINKIRNDRNLAVHTIRVKKYNKEDYIKAHEDLKYLITKIKVGKNENFNEAMNIYNKIGNEIINLMRNELTDVYCDK